MPLMYQQKSLQMEWAWAAIARRRITCARRSGFNMRYQQPTSAHPVVWMDR